MFQKQNLIYTLYYINMSIIKYKRRMIFPLFELDKNKAITYDVFYNNQICQVYVRYWLYILKRFTFVGLIDIPPLNR